MYWGSLTFYLRSLQSADWHLGPLAVGIAEKDVDIKIKLYFKLEFCEWMDVFTVSYDATVQLQRN